MTVNDNEIATNALEVVKKMVDRAEDLRVKAETLMCHHKDDTDAKEKAMLLISFSRELLNFCDQIIP